MEEKGGLGSILKRDGTQFKASPLCPLLQEPHV